MTGQQVLLTGRTIGAYMVQDGRRALDYLLTRSDVDPKRIAVAGNSGGGTQSALLGAVEPRLAAVVVSCYMTSWADMWVTPGPQDSEQILPGFLTRGLDFADFAVAAAPRGFLVSSAIQDFFPIAGSRKASAELTPLYAVLGASGRLARVENDATHGWSQPLREGAYLALGNWLGRPGLPTAEAPVTPEPIDALRVTATGQLATSGGSRTVREVNAAEALALARSRPPVTEGGLARSRRRPAPTRAGHSAPARIVERSGDARSSNGERLLIEVEPGVRLRGWLRRAATPAGAGHAAGGREGGDAAWCDGGRPCRGSGTPYSRSTFVGPARSAPASAKAATPPRTSSPHGRGCSGRQWSPGRRATSCPVCVAPHAGARCRCGAPACGRPDRPRRALCRAGGSPGSARARGDAGQLPRSRDRGRPRPSDPRGPARRASGHGPPGVDGTHRPCASPPRAAARWRRHAAARDRGERPTRRRAAGKRHRRTLSAEKAAGVLPTPRRPTGRTSPGSGCRGAAGRRRVARGGGPCGSGPCCG